MASLPPDPRPATGPWQKLGRLLPATLRKRVFEPAYFDLLAGRRGNTRMGLRVLGLALETFRVGIPPLVWNSLRASRRTRIALLLVVFGLTAAALMLTTYQYPPTGRP